MIGSEDNKRTQNDIAYLFHATLPNLPPISHGTISKQFRELGPWTCRVDKKAATNAMSDDVKLDIMLEFEENPHTSSRKAAPIFYVSHSSITRTLKRDKLHSYKIIRTQELMDDLLNRRMYFGKQLISMLDNNVV